ncbi:unnamed protein product [Ophioblennius macclurei]
MSLLSSWDEDEDLQSWGWTDLSSYSSLLSDWEEEALTGVMSRRSLRLDDSLLDRSLPHCSASFGAGAACWRSSNSSNSRSLRHRGSQQLSASCSESLLLPRTPLKSAGLPLLESSVHSVASDASLISSLLEESTVQESTLIDTIWGLDHDSDFKESAATAEESSTAAKPPLDKLYCTNCEAPCSSCASSSGQTELREEEEEEVSTVYRGGRRRKKQEHVLQVVGDGAAHCLGLLRHAWKVSAGSKVTQEPKRAARPAPPGVMSLKDGPAEAKEAQPVGSLCGECQEVQRSGSDAVSSSSSSSSSSSVLSLLWSSAVFTASILSLLAHTAVTVLWPLIREAFRAAWSSGRSAGGALADALGPTCGRWSRSCSSLTRSSLGLLLLLLILLPLLLVSVSWFGPPALQSVPLSDSTTTALSEVPRPESSEGEPAEDEGALHPDAAETDEGDQEAERAEASAEWSRLSHVEQRLAALWDRVEDRGRRAQRRHDEVLRLYSTLHQQRDGEEAWLSQLLDQQLSEIRRQLDEDQQQREQMRQMDLMQQHDHASRLDQLELQLKALTDKTQLVLLKQEVTTSVSDSTSTLPTAVSSVADRQSHDALVAEVARLETALQDVRRDMQSLSGCGDSCRQLATVQQDISGQVAVQVREALQALVSGADGGGGGAALSQSLLQWLSQRCVSQTHLQEALSSLQSSILHNISLQLEQQQQQQQQSDDPVRDSVMDLARGSVTAEDVHQMVTDALRLFSQDKIGMADYALESGGGSILSTRCSETYVTKAALLSLLGVPLWYFSQSPRTVIQPDVHPGNCWAFKGSSGFLVIRLSMRIRPTAFSLEHISRALAPNSQLLSAPRDFTVYGLEQESDENGMLLGTYTYNQDGEALQTFAVTEDTEETFQIVEVRILSNWGHPDYTCLYRIRVHGTPAAL